MKMSELTALAVQYHTLFTRYAAFIVKNNEAAEKITIAVFEDYFDSSIELSDDAKRLWLKSRVERKCREWLRNEALVNIRRLHEALDA